MAEIGGGRKIARNTIMLYVRLIVNMAISLYTSRVVLQILGIDDFGIYSVISGVLVLFSFLNTSMSGATSRYITFELGKNNKDRLSLTFSTSVIVHILIAIIIAVLCETIGIWFINNELVIPSDKLYAAHWVFQFAILSMIITVTQVPYNSIIFSYERMNVYAYIEIISSLLKLGIVYLLLVGNFDKLILYAILNFGATFIVGCLYRYYCIHNFHECKLRWIWDGVLVRNLLSFSGWDLYGNLSVVARTQGINMLLNMFFGPMMNAASDIATKVQGIIMNLSTNVSLASRPQIVKNYSIDNHSQMILLMRDSARITFILMMILSIPLMIEIDFILNLWLGIVPEHTAVICILTLLWNTVASMTITNNYGVQASAKVKFVSIISGTLFMLVVPITYLSFKFGLPYWLPYALNVFTLMISPFISGYTLKKHLRGYSIHSTLIPDLIRDWCALIVTFLFTISLSFFLATGWLKLVIVCLISTATSILTGYLIVFPKNRRDVIKNQLKTYIACKRNR